MGVMSFNPHQWRVRRVLLYLCVFVLGALALFVMQRLSNTYAPCHQQYNLLSSTKRCADEMQQGEWDYEPLRDALSTKKEALKSTKALTHISIYFRDLDHGPRFGIGEYDKFQPASLTKVPVLIAFLHLADLDPSILSKTLSFTGTLAVNDNVEMSDETIRPNTPYTIRELLTKMIVYSDNYSYKLLTRELNSSPKVVAYYTFRDLDILRMMMAPKSDFVSIQSYATLFAVLHGTGYLSKDMSQFALELLSNTTFNEGLVAGVPKGIRVAHKFGHRILKGEDQLHDCGIIYHPDMTYLLCILTTGSSYENEKAAIRDVSQMVFDAVSSLHRKDQ